MTSPVKNYLPQNYEKKWCDAPLKNIFPVHPTGNCGINLSVYGTVFCAWVLKSVIQH